MDTNSAIDWDWAFTTTRTQGMPNAVVVVVRPNI
jgi:hypothetical protein